MCGIAGFTRFKSLDIQPESLLSQMGERLRHRGPDASGHYMNPRVGLCHQRLSIIDVSDAGNQPMTSRSGRFVLIYNGEIYNFEQLRQHLVADGVDFKSHSDTEVLLALYEREGTACLNRLNGMFAFAVWDNLTHTLFLARDRLGKKPLYFYHKDGHFIFASEIKAILSAPGIDTALRPDAMHDFFTYQYVPDPKSIYQHIHKLPPGHWMSVDEHQIKQKQYWDVSFAQTKEMSIDETAEKLHDLLDDSVRSRMISDVPLGAFLSGGIDSSAIVGLMARNSSQPVTTCSIGFDSKSLDETDQARELSEHFGTDHHEYIVKENITERLYEIATNFDEPFSDPSFVPTFFVSQLARRNVVVALSGDGGDENFAGYSKYAIDRTENSLRSLFPALIRHALFPGTARLLSASSSTLASRGSSLLTSLSMEPDQAFALSNSFFDAALWDAVILDNTRRSLGDYQPSVLTKDLYARADTDDHLASLLYVDLKSYLPGDILVKVDRMSMMNSLETRAPLLDYRIVEFAASLASDLKLREKTGKFILKKSVEQLLPKNVLQRKKQGFSVPLAHWLRHELKDYAYAYLFSRRSGLSNYFNISALATVWKSHQSCKRDYSSELWSLLMFELWWQRSYENQNVCQLTS